MTDTEKAALERRIDELCAEVEYDRQTSRSRLERIDQLKAENAKLREFATQMAEALGIDSEWKNPYEDCKSPCKLKFGCCACRSKALCPAFARMTELGIEVSS